MQIDHNIFKDTPDLIKMNNTIKENYFTLRMVLIVRDAL